MALSYRATGNHTTDTDAAAFTESTVSWYFLAGIDVIGAPRHRDGVVVFGDSLTDGFGSTPGADNRFPDELAERLVAAAPAGTHTPRSRPPRRVATPRPPGG